MRSTKTLLALSRLVPADRSRLHSSPSGSAPSLITQTTLSNQPASRPPKVIPLLLVLLSNWLTYLFIAGIDFYIYYTDQSAPPLVAKADNVVVEYMSLADIAKRVAVALAKASHSEGGGTECDR